MGPSKHSRTRLVSNIMGATMQPQAAPSESAVIDRRLAGAVKTLLSAGDQTEACERFEEIVERHQRRATRIAYYYLRNAADVDEAVQDAFVKAFVHLPSFREDLLFELWFTKIVVNGCLDRLKARKRLARWMVSAGEDEYDVIGRHFSDEPSPEKTLLSNERGAKLRVAVDQLPDRQRVVVVLSQFQGHTTREVSQVLGLNEATVRVHLFRAIRSLRKLLSHHTRLSPALGAVGIL